MTAARAAAVVVALALAALSACPASHRPAGPGPTGPIDPAVAPIARDLAPPAELRLPPHVAPTAYRLALAIDPEQPAFTGEVEIDVALAGDADVLWLHAAALAIEEATITIDGATAPLALVDDAAHERVGLDPGRRLAAGTAATVRLRYRGTIVDDEPMGLFRQREGGRWYVYSQMQGIYARRVVPCFDEPGWKVPWQVTVTAPDGLVVAGNAPERARAPRDGGRVAIDLAPTAPMPSYLLAVAVGPFELVEVAPVGRDAAPARILVPAGQRAHAGAAALATPAIVTALEAYFDRALPVPKLDLVAVPVFFGGMENVGLITVAAPTLLQDPARPSRDGRRAMLDLIAHEVAHQWFGDLVTPRWWDDLWLNESFATWMAGKIVRQLDPHEDAIAAHRRTLDQAMAADALPSAQPLQRPIRGDHDVDDSFDAIAYQKGAALLAMFERHLGADRFRAGVRSYVAAHAGGSATGADFVAALAAASEPETATAFAGFLHAKGVPVIDLALDCTGDAPAGVASARVAPDLPAPWPLPLCVRFPDGAGGRGQVCGWVPPGGARLALPRCPAWLAGNADGAGYYRVAYAPALADALRANLRRVAVGERAAIAADLIALARDGRADVATFPAWVDAFLDAGHRHDVSAAVALAELLGTAADDADLAAWRRWVQRRFAHAARKAGLVGRAHETVAAAAARRALAALVGASAREPSLVKAARRQVDAWLGGAADPGDDRDLLLAIATVDADLALHARLVDAARATADRTLRAALIAALARFRDPAAIARNRALFLDRVFDPREAQPLVTGALGSRSADAAAWAELTAHHEPIAALLSPAERPELVAAAGARCTADAHAEVAGFFGPRAAGDPRTARALALALEAIDRCVADRARLRDAVRAALAK